MRGACLTSHIALCSRLLSAPVRPICSTSPLLVRATVKLRPQATCLMSSSPFTRVGSSRPAHPNKHPWHPGCPSNYNGLCQMHNKPGQLGMSSGPSPDIRKQHLTAWPLKPCETYSPPKIEATCCIKGGMPGMRALRVPGNPLVSILLLGAGRWALGAGLNSLPPDRLQTAGQCGPMPEHSDTLHRLGSANPSCCHPAAGPASHLPGPPPPGSPHGGPACHTAAR